MVKGARVDKNGLKQGAWTEDEDNKLRTYVLRYGHWNWRLLPKFAGLDRCGKSCRLRWVNYLKPGVRRGSYTKEEQDLIAKLHDELGNKWSAISAKLPGRTDNDVKNYWHAHIKKLNKRSNKSCHQAFYGSDIPPDMFISESSSSNSLISNGSINRDLDSIAEQNCSQISNSLGFNVGANGHDEDSATSLDLVFGFYESFWTEPFMVDTSDTLDFHFSLLDDHGGLF